MFADSNRMAGTNPGVTHAPMEQRSEIDAATSHALRRPYGRRIGAFLATLGVGALCGGALGTVRDARTSTSLRADAIERGRQVQREVMLAERGLLSVLVMNPMDVEGALANANLHLLRAQDALNGLTALSVAPQISTPREKATAALASLVHNGDLLSTSIRGGDYPAALHVAADIAGTPAAVLTGESNAESNAEPPPDGPVAAEVMAFVVAMNQAAPEQTGSRRVGAGFGALGAALAAELRRRRRRETARAHLHALADRLSVVEPALIVLDRLGRIEHITDAASTVLVGAPGLTPGSALVAVAGPAFAGLAGATADEAPINVVTNRGVVPIHVEASTPVTADDGQAILWVLHDVTEERSREGELTRKAYHDPLTLLPNRERFRQILQDALQHNRPTELSVLFVDLDGFKLVNDTFGHGVGDRLLIDVTARLAEIVHSNDVVGRLGGDEFAVLLRSSRPRYAEVIAEQIVHELTEPFVIDGRSLRIGGSVGYTAAGPNSSVEELLQQADVAMYVAKERGKGRTARYEPEMLAANRRRMTFDRELQGVASSGQLRLLYQPVVSLATGQMVGMEALVRWQHPERGLVSPVEFIAAAEANGSIIEIGQWVLRNGLAEFAGLPLSLNLRLNVNVSPRQLSEPDFVTMVENELRRTTVPASSVTFEVTESLLLGDVDKSIERLAELKALGLRLAIDDFGTGYSSLSYLARLPVDVVKIDKSFVDELRPEDEGPGHESNATSRKAFIGALVSLAHARGLTVVAEGIEHAFQVPILRGLGCEYGQGYLFAKPLPASSLTAAIDSFEPETGPDPAGSGTAFDASLA